MDRSIELRLDVLRRALDLVLEELEATHGALLRIDRDYFWSIPAEQRMNVYEQPKDLTVGQLSELIEGMEKLVEDPERVTVVDAVKLAELLRNAGDALPS
jgi:hypothetical protein